MPTLNITINIRLNLEGEWPRSAYLQHCVENGVDYTEEGYLRWRDVGERLTGQRSFESNVKRAAAALESLGKTFADLGPHMNNLVKRAQAHEEGQLRRSRRLTDADR